MKKIISIALAALFAASLSISAQAAENPFGMADLQQSAKVAMSTGKCAGGDDGKCGGDKGKCGGDKKEGKKDGKCGGDKGKCGGDK